ncbi:hypothetical protein RO3G_03935 [Rhizopus delemar RA 99-880]|uniref:Uncharacterized protein n=1 Tax=Rhizopus delemar (strain RA 99-880 / ATCC MYA-4621 / FGSC 9543 / NRRL 43880) TaxID=246409 RepID=I1BSQ0_RHIO9|nr:hypothetical protein RO3G_03935 [Rhizopus delemar RA 99-880]|eukprot:EIE79230.1 hypothetical protein RO3G_03935 [Rhizopus delemar RA 99-880]
MSPHVLNWVQVRRLRGPRQHWIFCFFFKISCCYLGSVFWIIIVLKNEITISQSVVSKGVCQFSF